MKRDFSEGSIPGLILRQAVPLMVAQLVQLLYNVVDRIYIGHLPGTNGMALTGIGLVFPITTLIAAFTLLFGTGASPLFAIARGAGNEERARTILGNTFVCLAATGAALTVLGFLFGKPVLYAFGAGDATYGYARDYLNIYLLGTVFSMEAAGLNGLINAQGFPGIGMLTTVIGAALNLILDPIFIFGLHMGVRGAALATILSQAASALWVVRFLSGNRVPLRLEKPYMKLKPGLVREICTLGLSGFVMQGTNCLVQVVCNVMLRTWGGDLYVAVITIINSVRDMSSLVVSGLTSGAQPVLGFNYGARRYDRVKQGIRFMASIGILYTVLFWGAVSLWPEPFISIFTSDPQLLAAGVPSLRIYFFGFCFMAFQFTGQSTFTSLGCARRAIFFSLLRKAFIVVPLTLLLPQIGFGVNGVFLAEPISNLLGGLACFITMYFTVYRRLGRETTEHEL